MVRVKQQVTRRCEMAAWRVEWVCHLPVILNGCIVRLKLSLLYQMILQDWALSIRLLIENREL